jgi:hypothetical protein
MRAGLRRFAAAALPAAFAALLLSACPLKELSLKPATTPPPTADKEAESRGPDPRAAFESSGLFGGVSAPPEAPVPLIPPAGLPESGVALSLGGALSTAAVARTLPAAGSSPGHELTLASGARASLPGPVLAMAAAGERIVVACADPRKPGLGHLLSFKTEGEGERLVEAWSADGPVTRRLLAVPGGRVAMSGESAILRIADAATGAQVWAQKLATDAADLAYAPGLVLAASGSSLEAFDESTGTSVWKAALTARATSISAGSGTALVLAESGSLSAFSLADGKGIGAAPGPFDPSLKPVADGSRAIAALVGGGAVELDVKSGQNLRSWAWEGTTSFIVADRDRLFVGLDGREGRGILLLARAGETGRTLARLESPAFDAPLAVSGARGGLLLLLMDGSLVLVGRDREPTGAASALDIATAAPSATATAITTALGRFKPRDAAPPSRYLRFDLFAPGMPVDEAVAFTAFRYEPAASAKHRFFAKPASQGAIVAIYDDAGHELAASIDELGSNSAATAFFEKGRSYWIVAGWSYQASPESFRLYLK